MVFAELSTNKALKNIGGETINLTVISWPLRSFMSCSYGLHKASAGELNFSVKPQMIDSPKLFPATSCCEPVCTSDITNKKYKNTGL